MNHIKGLLIIGIFLLSGFNGEMIAQSEPSAIAKDANSLMLSSSLDGNIFDIQGTRGEDIVWKRDVYRIVDLKNGTNGVLYYPVESTPERKNLFCTIFEQMADRKLTAYQYLDGREVFTESNSLKFEDLLKRFDIPFKEVSDPRKTNSKIFEVAPIDVPSSDVTQFYVKETYYIDQLSGLMHIITVDICPVLIRTDELGELRKYPMCWIPLDDLKDCLSRMPVAVSEINSAVRISAYDFLNEHLYTGEIYKVFNLKNQTLWDYCKTPEEIKAEQLRLKKELQSIADNFWNINPLDMVEVDTVQNEKAERKSNYLKIKKQRTDFVPSFALKECLTLDALRIPNLGFEMTLKPQLTLDIVGLYNPFQVSNTKKWKLWTIQPELRYRFNKKKKDIFSGSFVGLHAGYGQFNVAGVGGALNIWNVLKLDMNKEKENHLQGSFWDAGLSYGYNLKLSSRWGVEATVGFGYARYSYKRYEKVYDDLLGEGTENYIGPTRASISIVYSLTK